MIYTHTHNACANTYIRTCQYKVHVHIHICTQGFLKLTKTCTCSHFYQILPITADIKSMQAVGPGTSSQSERYSSKRLFRLVCGEPLNTVCTHVHMHILSFLSFYTLTSSKPDDNSSLKWFTIPCTDSLAGEKKQMGGGREREGGRE